MEKNSRIFIAGHRGLVGSAIRRGLAQRGYSRVLLRTHGELDLANREAVRTFFRDEQPEYVFLAAAKVGGILANESQPAEFIRENLEIQTSVIDAAWQSGVKRLLFLASSCIYPRMAPQPIKEEYLLTGPLERTNRPYAVAKIAGIEMCWSYNRQYGTRFLTAAPSNLYGPEDSFDPLHSHMLPALIRKVAQAKEAGDRQITVWGTGTPRRELLYSEDLANGCIHLMNLPDEDFDSLLPMDAAPLINLGTGVDESIGEIAELVMKVLGFEGEMVFDRSRPDGTMRKLLDVSKINSLGWKADTSLEAGIRKTYEAAKERLELALR